MSEGALYAWAAAGIVLVVLVYQASPTWGALLLLVLVFGMLLQARKSNVI